MLMCLTFVALVALQSAAWLTFPAQSRLSAPSAAASAKAAAALPGRTGKTGIVARVFLPSLAA
jgi:hypothetical protein